MKDKTNEELKLIIDNSNLATLNYRLENDTIENVIKNLNMILAIAAIDEILERLKTEVSYSNFEKLKEKISDYQKTKKELSKYYEIYDEKIKRDLPTVLKNLIK
jgi:mevalonate kinase